MFDYGGSFLVVKSDDPMAVASALRLENVTDYRETPHERNAPKRVGPTWISQPVRGYVIVSGAVPHGSLDLSASDPALADVQRLSRNFGETFVFGEDNGCPYCHYAWCRDGEIVRAYAMVTDPDCVVLWNVGEPTEVERAFSVPLRYLDSRHEGPVAHEEYSQWLPFEETAFTLASAWCVSPEDLTAREELECFAIGGRMPVPWTLPYPTPECGESRTEAAGDVGDVENDDDDAVTPGGGNTYTFEVSGNGLGSVTFPIPEGPDAAERAQQILRALRMVGVSDEQMQDFVNKVNALSKNDSKAEGTHEPS